MDGMGQIKPQTEIIVKRNRIYADGQKIGWYLLSLNLLYMKVKGKKINILYRRKTGLTMLLGIEPVAEMSSGILEYNNERFKITGVKRGSRSVPGIARAESDELIAVSKGNGAMEFYAELDPILIAFSIFYLCMLLKSTSFPMDYSGPLIVEAERLENIFGTRKVFFEKFLPIIFLPATVIFVLLAQYFQTGIWAKILIGGYAAFLIGTLLLMIFYTYFRRIEVVDKSSS